MSNDGDLLTAWRAGDRAAGAELFARHFAAVYGFFRNKLEDAAEDLTQQTFLRCVESRDVFRGDGASFRTYMFQIARNLLYEQLRRRSVRNHDPDFELEALADLIPSPSANIGVRQEHRVLLEAMRRLPLALQVALELYYVQRLRGEDIAVVLSIPVGTVRSRIRRALDRLRELIAEFSATPQDWRTTLTDLQRWAAGVRDAAARLPAVPRPDAD